MMNMKNKIDETAAALMKPDSKIGILATADEAGYPHLTLISSLQAFGEDQITFGKFCVGLSKGHLEKRPDAAFLALTPDMQWLKGNAKFTHTENTGLVFEEYNNKPLFRYNTYFGFDHIYFLDLIRISEVSKLPMSKIVLGAILSRVCSVFLAKKDKQILTRIGKGLFAKLDGLKFISWYGEDGQLEIEPIIQAGPAGTDRIAFFGTPYGSELKRIPKGAKTAIFCTNMELHSVLVKGIFGKAGCVYTLDIEKVYNSMPPQMQYIYPRAAAPAAVTEF
jgi:hypothetical protein